MTSSVTEGSYYDKKWLGRRGLFCHWRYNSVRNCDVLEDISRTASGQVGTVPSAKTILTQLIASVLKISMKQTKVRIKSYPHYFD